MIEAVSVLGACFSVETLYFSMKMQNEFSAEWVLCWSKVTASFSYCIKKEESVLFLVV